MFEPPFKSPKAQLFSGFQRPITGKFWITRIGSACPKTVISTYNFYLPTLGMGLTPSILLKWCVWILRDRQTCANLISRQIQSTLENGFMEPKWPMRFVWVIEHLNDHYLSTPLKILTWDPKMEVLKMIFLFKQLIFKFHVNFPGCICQVMPIGYIKNPFRHRQYSWLHDGFLGANGRRESQTSLGFPHKP